MNKKDIAINIEYTIEDIYIENEKEFIEEYKEILETNNIITINRIYEMDKDSIIKNIEIMFKNDKLYVSFNDDNYIFIIKGYGEDLEVLIDNTSSDALSNYYYILANKLFITFCNLYNISNYFTIKCTMKYKEYNKYYF